MKKRRAYKVLSWILAMIMIIGAAPITAFAESGISPAETALNETIEEYYIGSESGVLDDWEELTAVYGAGKPLTDFVLPAIPQMPASASSAVIISLIKGDMESAKQAMCNIVTGGAITLPGYAYGVSINMIAAEAYNRAAAANVSDDYTEMLYDKDIAVDALLTYKEEDGGFGFGFGGDPDTTGISLLALSLYMNDEEISDREAVNSAIENSINYLKTAQQANGGFLGWSGNNANSAAAVTLGLIAVGEDPLSAEWKKDGKGLLDALLSFHVTNGGFDDTSNVQTDFTATKQAALAVAEIIKVNALTEKTSVNISSCSVLGNLTLNSKQYLSANVQVVDTVGNFTEKSITVSDDENLSDATSRVLKTTVSMEDFNYYINDELIDSGLKGSYSIKNDDKILAIYNTYNAIAYFETSDSDPMGVKNTEIDYGDSIELKLVKTDFTTKTALSGVPIDINGDGYQDLQTSSAGAVTITPIVSETNIRAIKSDYAGTYIGADIAVLPAVIKMRSGDPQSCSVSIRFEGKTRTLLYYSTFEVQNEGESRLTVYDAVIQALDNADIDYNWTTHLSSVGGEAGESPYGWMYLYNDTSLDVGMPGALIEENAEIIVFYGGYPPVLPELQTELNEDDLELTFINKMDGSPIEGLTVYWNGTALDGYTDISGKITVHGVEAGSYTLQVDKSVDGIPSVIRLAPGYEVTVEDGGASGNLPTLPGEEVAKVYITVIGPDSDIIFAKKAFTYSNGITALDLLRRTGLRVGYNNSSKTYVSRIGDYEEFDYGPTSGWLFKVNDDETILSSAADYELEAEDELVWFYSKDYTKEEGSKEWGGLPKEKESAEAGSGKDMVEIPFTLDGSTAKLNINDDTLDDLLKAGSKSGNLSIDISGITDADAVSIPTDTLEAINDNVKIKVLSVVLPSGEITLDEAAMDSILEDAGSSTVTFSCSKVNNKDLTKKQKDAAGDRPVYDISILSGKTKITEFEGKLTISVPYSLKEDENPTGIVVYHLDSSGNLVREEGTYNPATGTVTFSVDHLSYFVIGYDSSLVKWPFTDVAQDGKINWYYSAVKFVYENGIFSGTSNTAFEPDGSMTRAMLVSVLARLNKENLSAYKVNPFTDTDINSWYGPSVAWAKENGIVSGYKDKNGVYTFKPDDRITRQDIAVIFNNYIKKYPLESSIKGRPAIAFKDQSNIADYARQAVAEMQKAGIINGVKNADGSYSFLPSANATRAEAAVMIKGMLNK